MLRIYLGASKNLKAFGALSGPQTPSFLGWDPVIKYLHKRALSSLVFYKNSGKWFLPQDLGLSHEITDFQG